MIALQYTPYTIPLLLAAAMCAGVAYVMWRRRTGPGALPTVALMLGVIIWVLSYAGSLSSSNPSVKSILYNIEYIGITILPAAWFAFVAQYIGREKWITRRTLALLTIEPLLVALAIWTNDSNYFFHGPNVYVVTNGFLIMTNLGKTGFWLHAVYSYVILLVSSVLLIRSLRRSPGLYRSQLAMLLLATFAPWVANGIYLGGLSPFPYLDLTPFAFTITGLALTWSMVRFRLFDITPIARDRVFESIRDAVVVLDGRGNIVDINPAGVTLLQISSPSQVIGKLVSQVLPGQSELIQKFRTVNEARTEISVPSQGGGLRTFELKISPLNSSRGLLTGRLLVLHEITDLKRAAEQINAQNETLRKTNVELAKAQEAATEGSRLKSQFLATMSHELRTPLNAIMGYAQLQLAGIAGTLTDQQRQYQERTLVNAGDLLRLINEVLDLSKIEAGRMELINKPYNLRECLDEAISQSRVLATTKNLTIGVEIDKDLPVLMVGDVARIKQIVINLLSNAIKFTEVGGVRVVLNRVPGNWQLAVSDTGIGIPPHMQEIIFDEFRQVDNSSQRQFGGTGLGLSIVRKLVLLMGGSIRVSSTPGVGSTFTLTLPLISVEHTEESSLRSEYVTAKP